MIAEEGQKIERLDEKRNIRFDTSVKDFVLPEEFDQLIAEEGQKIEKLDEERKLIVLINFFLLSSLSVCII